MHFLRKLFTASSRNILIVLDPILKWHGFVVKTVCANFSSSGLRKKAGNGASGKIGMAASRGPSEY